MMLLVLLFLLKLVHVQSQSSIISPGGSCPDLETINDPRFVVYSKDPIFMKFATNTTKFKGADSVCYTVDCAPDGPNYYIEYLTVGYSDGSVTVNTTVIKEGLNGMNIISGTSYFSYQYRLGVRRYSSGVTSVGYVCEECGLESEQYGFGSSNTYGRISDKSVEDARSILAAQGVDSEEVMVFPMKLGPKCYYSSCTNCYGSASPCSRYGGNGC